jgi:AAA family ATP:ADP antiporter
MKLQFPHLRFQKKAIMQRIMEEVRLYQNTLSVLYAQIKIGKEVNSHAMTPAETAQEKVRANLVQLLEARMDGHLERIFRLLGLKYPAEDILPIFQGLQSNKLDLRVNSVEFLENLLDSSLKKVLIPVLETALLDGITAETIENLDINIPDEMTCYTTLLEGKDIQLKYAVLQLLSQSQDARFLPLIKKYATSESLRIKTVVMN